MWILKMLKRKKQKKMEDACYSIERKLEHLKLLCKSDRDYKIFEESIKETLHYYRITNGRRTNSKYADLNEISKRIDKYTLYITKKQK